MKKNQVFSLIFMIITIASLYVSMWYYPHAVYLFIGVTFSITVSNLTMRSMMKSDAEFKAMKLMTYQVKGFHLPVLVDISFYMTVIILCGYIQSWFLLLAWWYNFYCDLGDRVESKFIWRMMSDEARDKIMSSAEAGEKEK